MLNSEQINKRRDVAGAMVCDQAEAAIAMRAALVLIVEHLEPLLPTANDIRIVDSYCAAKSALTA